MLHMIEEIENDTVKMEGWGVYQDVTLGIRSWQCLSRGATATLRPVSYSALLYLSLIDVSSIDSQSLYNTNYYSLSPSCLNLTLRLPRLPIKPPASNSSSSMLWTNTRSAQRKTYSNTPSSPNFNIATLPVPFLLFFTSNSKG